MLLNRLRHAPWLRTAMRVLVLCFALGTLAYASHAHPLAQTGDTHYSCDFCTGFGGLIDAPVQQVVVPQPLTSTDIVAASGRIFANHPVGIAQARAPPTC